MWGGLTKRQGKCKAGYTSYMTPQAGKPALVSHLRSPEEELRYLASVSSQCESGTLGVPGMVR